MMKMEGIETGKEFEMFCLDLLSQGGLKVTDTPVTNDYGSDLLIDYHGHRFSAQCKYYQKSVGVKAVQEVMGSLSYYKCDYGVVITNSSFTQQAINLAITNNVMLITGIELNCFMNNLAEIDVYFNQFLNQNKRQYTDKNLFAPSNDWGINDLLIRY